ncbi:MAG: DUF4160 domain-containing protein [Rhodospirillales bacterium]
MPSIKDFGGFEIYMYFEDHGVPHFHVVSAEYHASIAIEDLTILAGDLPPKAFKTATTWAARNRAILWRKWKEYSE